MKVFLRIVVAALLLAGWGLFASAVHVVRGPDRVAVIPKDRLGLADTFVDVRGWTLDDVRAHPSVAARLVATGKASMLTGLDGDTPPGEAVAGDVARRVSDAVAEGRRRAEDAARDATDAARRAAERVEADLRSAAPTVER